MDRWVQVEGEGKVPDRPGTTSGGGRLPGGVVGLMLGVGLWLGMGQGVAAGPLERLLAATCRIVHHDSSGTAFLVQPPKEAHGPRGAVVLVTAAHFFEELTEAECQWVLRVRDAGGVCGRREQALAVRRDDQPLWKKHPDLDVAAMWVTLPEGVALEPLAWEALVEASAVAARQVRVGQEVFIACYPAKLEANAAGWPVLRRGSIASHPLAPVASVPTVLIDADTFGGDSGAPVATVAEEELRVMGLVVGMQRQTDKVSLPFEERTMHTPMGLGIVVQAAFIRDTIEALGR